MERRANRRTGTEDVQGAYERELAARLERAGDRSPTGTEQVANAGHNGIANQSETVSREAAARLGRSALRDGPSGASESRPEDVSLWRWLHTPAKEQ